MTKRIFLMFIGLTMMTLNYAQTSTQVVGKSERLNSISNFKELADQVNVAYQVYQEQGVTGTRTSTANAKTSYDNALLAYQTELEKHLLLQSSADYLTDLNAEIALVKDLRTNLNPTVSK